MVIEDDDDEDSPEAEGQTDQDSKEADAEDAADVEMKDESVSRTMLHPRFPLDGWFIQSLP